MKQDGGTVGCQGEGNAGAYAATASGYEGSLAQERKGERSLRWRWRCIGRDRDFAALVMAKVAP